MSKKPDNPDDLEPFFRAFKRNEPEPPAEDIERIKRGFLLRLFMSRNFWLIVFILVLISLCIFATGEF